MQNLLNKKGSDCTKSLISLWASRTFTLPAALSAGSAVHSVSSGSVPSPQSVSSLSEMDTRGKDGFLCFPSLTLKDTLAWVSGHSRYRLLIPKLTLYHLSDTPENPLSLLGCNLRSKSIFKLTQHCQYLWLCACYSNSQNYLLLMHNQSLALFYFFLICQNPGCCFTVSVHMDPF